MARGQKKLPSPEMISKIIDLNRWRYWWNNRPVGH